MVELERNCEYCSQNKGFTSFGTIFHIECGAKENNVLGDNLVHRDGSAAVSCELFPTYDTRGVQNE